MQSAPQQPQNLPSQVDMNNMQNIPMDQNAYNMMARNNAVSASATNFDMNNLPTENNATGMNPMAAAAQANGQNMGQFNPNGNLQMGDPRAAAGVNMGYGGYPMAMGNNMNNYPQQDGNNPNIQGNGQAMTQEQMQQIMNMQQRMNGGGAWMNNNMNPGGN